MALDVDKLTSALITVFADGLKATSSDDVAKSLAQAIHDYVSQAEVGGIESDVVDNANQPLGTGTQKANVTIT